MTVAAARDTLLVLRTEAAYATPYAPSGPARAALGQVGRLATLALEQLGDLSTGQSESVVRIATALVSTVDPADRDRWVDDLRRTLTAANRQEAHR